YQRNGADSPLTPPHRRAITFPDPPQDEVRRAVEGHYRAARHESGHPIAANRHPAEGRCIKARRAHVVKVEEDEVAVAHGEPVVIERKQECDSRRGKQSRVSPRPGICPLDRPGLHARSDHVTPWVVPWITCSIARRVRGEAVVNRTLLPG